MDVLEMNYEGNLEGKLDFFSGRSEFYDEFDALLRERVCAAHIEAQEEL